MIRTLICLLLLVSILGLMPFAGMACASPAADRAAETPGAKALEAFGKLPLLFIPNQGQLDEAVKYYVKTPSQTLYFTERGIVFDLIRYEPAEDGAAATRKAERLAFSLDFLNASSSLSLEPLLRDGAVVNYLIGNDPARWHTDIPTYRELVYRDIYPGIDLRLYGSGGALRYDFTVNPGASPDSIKLACSVTDGLSIRDGNLVIVTPFGEISQTRPYIYQQIDGKEVEVKGDFRLGDGNTYGFYVAAYNSDYPLIIDPTLAYSTYLGGARDDRGYGIAVDAAGCAYISGYTLSNDFPTQNPFQAANVGYYDVFVAKLSAAGNSLIYSTYLGGTSGDFGFGIAVDAAGCAYVTGETSSDNFPTQNPCQASIAGNSDVFVTKLSAAGNSLVYSTYLGGADIDCAYGIAVDAAGCAYVTGRTASDNFPTQNPCQAARAGGDDAFVAKLSAAGNSLVYSTYLGGAGDDSGRGIAVDAAGCAYISGYTLSNDFPTRNPYQAANGGGYDAFVTKLSAAGNSLVYSTYLGGAGNDFGRGIAVDAAGCAYVIGYTTSNDFPTRNPYQAANGGGYDVFVAKLSAAGNSLIYSTYLGGTREDRGCGIAVDAADCAYITGYTYSNNFPTQNPYQPVWAGSYDAFVTKLSAAGNSLIYSTYLGGSDIDCAYGIAVDSSGCAYVTGYTASNNFPTQNPYQEARAGSSDAFVAKLCPVPPAVTTQAATGVGAGSATLNMSYTLGEFGTVDVRFAYRRAADTVWTYTSWSAKSAAGSHAQTVTGLNPGTTYDCKAQLRYLSTTIEGTTLQFTTGGIPLVGTGTPHGSAASVPASVNAPPVVNPSLIIQSASLSQTGRPGEAAVTAVVANTSTVNGITRVRLYVNGELDAEQTVSVEAGKQAPVSFTVVRSQPGTYQVYVNNTPAGSFAVDDYIHPDAILYISLTLVLVSLILVIIYIRSRRQVC